MPDPIITSGDSLYLAHPWTGQVTLVPRGEAGAAMAEGLRPASEDEVKQHRIAEHYGTPGMQVGAAAAGVGRGLTFGLSDLALTKSGIVAPESLQRLRQVNPTLSTAGEVTGAIGGVFLPGGLAGRVAEGAGAAGRLAGRGAKALIGGAEGRLAGAVPRLAEAVGREATFGAAVGAGHGITEIALRDMDVDEGTKVLLRSLASGAEVGAGFGVLAFGAGAAGRAVRRRFDYGLAEVRELRKARDTVQGKMKVLESEGAETAQLQQQLDQITGQLRDQTSKAVGKVAARAVGAGIAMGLDMGISGGLLGAMVAPRVLAGLRSTLRGGAAGAGQAVRGALERLSPWTSRLGKAWEAVKGRVETMEGPAGELIRGQVARAGEFAKSAAAAKARDLGKAVAGRIPIDSEKARLALEVAGHGVGEAVGMAASLGTDAAAVGLVHGGLTGAALGLAAHASRKQITRLGDLLVQKVVPASRIAALETLTNTDIDAFGAELQHMSPVDLEAGILAQMPGGTPSQVVDGAKMQVLRAIQYLQQQHPGKLDRPVPTGAKEKPSDQEWRRFREQIRTVLQPGTALQAFQAGKLRPHHVQAWAAVYPEGLEQLRQVVRAEVESARAQGVRYDRTRGQQIALLLGDDAARPKIYDPRRVALLQAMHQGGKSQPGPKPRPRSVRGMSKAAQTQAQRIGS